MQHGGLPLVKAENATGRWQGWARLVMARFSIYSCPLLQGKLLVVLGCLFAFQISYRKSP